VLVGALSVGAACARQSNGYELVIVDGHVMDPESGLDAVRNVGVSDGTIQALTTESLRGAQVISAAGLVVAPGFIDLHQHARMPRTTDTKLQTV
jgi:N-acyl-D-aspartate/D-glutamate deacylase